MSAPSLRQRHRRTVVAALLVTAVGASLSSSASAAADLRLFCANGLKPVVAPLARQYEAASGNTVTPSFAEGTVLLQRLRTGERADVIVLTRDGLDAMAKQGELVPGSISDIASTEALGMAVRTGTAPANTRGIAAFKAWLLGAKSIVVTDPAIGGLSSQQFFKVIDRLGIADDLKPKLILATGAGTSNAVRVASGETEIAVQLAYLLRPVAGVELVPVPSEYQLTVTFAAAVSATTTDPAPAAALVAFLASPAAASVIAAAGMHRP